MILFRERKYIFSQFWPPGSSCLEGWEQAHKRKGLEKVVISVIGIGGRVDSMPTRYLPP